MSARRNQQHDVKAAAAQAALLLVKRQTCENCAYLRTLRPMCASELSPHYRTPREAHHDGCPFYSGKGTKTAPKPKPEVDPQPLSRAAIAGEVAKHKHNRWTKTA